MKKIVFLLSSILLVCLFTSCITVDKLNKATLKELQEMAKESSFVDYVANDGSNPLMIMVRNDNEVNTEYLLQNHFFDVNYSNNSGETALSIAITNDNTTIAQMLIDEGASLEPSAFSKKPLVIAVKKNKADCAQLLIKNGADTKVVDVDNNGLLHLVASVKKGVETAKVLLNNNVSLSTKNVNGETPLFIAFKNDNKNTAQEFLSRGASVLATDSSGNSLYHIIVQNNAIDLFDLVSNSTLSVDNRNNEGSSPIEIAIQADSYEMVTKLISVGAKINQLNSYGYYPVQYAVINEKTNALRALLENGADLNVKDSSGLTLLHKATEKESTEMMQLLLDTKKININAKSKSGLTPVAYAFVNSYEQSGEYLISHGADLYIADSQGKNAVAYRQSYYLKQADIYLQERNTESKLLADLQIEKKEHESMVDRYRLEERKSNSELYNIESTYEDAKLNSDKYYRDMRDYERDRNSYKHDSENYMALAEKADSDLKRYTYTKRALEANENAERMERRRRSAEYSYNINNNTVRNLEPQVSAARKTHNKWYNDYVSEQNALSTCQSKINDKQTYIINLQDKIDSARRNANMYPLTK